MLCNNMRVAICMYATYICSLYAMLCDLTLACVPREWAEQNRGTGQADCDLGSIQYRSRRRPFPGFQLSTPRGLVDCRDYVVYWHSGVSRRPHLAQSAHHGARLEFERFLSTIPLQFPSIRPVNTVFQNASSGRLVVVGFKPCHAIRTPLEVHTCDILMLAHTLFCRTYEGRISRLT